MLQAGAELGFPGLFLWLALIGGGIFGPYLLRRRLPREWRKGDAEERYLYEFTIWMPVAFAAFAVSSFFLTFAWLDLTYLLAGLLAGMYVAVGLKRRQNAQFVRPIKVPMQPEWRSAQAGADSQQRPALLPAGTSR